MQHVGYVANSKPITALAADVTAGHFIFSSLYNVNKQVLRSLIRIIQLKTAV